MRDIGDAIATKEKKKIGDVTVKTVHEWKCDEHAP